MPEKEKISGNDFIELLVNEDSLSNYIVTGEVKFQKDTPLGYNKYHFENIEFIDKVNANLNHSNIEFTLINNQLRKGLYISGVVEKINLVNSLISENFVIEKANIDKEIIIQQKTVIDSLLTLNSQIGRDFTIEKSEIKEFQNIYQSDVGSIKMKNESTIGGSLRIDQSSFKSIIINDSRLTGDIWFWNSNINNILSIHRSNFEDSFNVEACGLKELYTSDSNFRSFWYTFSSNKTRGKRIISKRSDQITFKNSSFINRCVIEDPFQDELKISLNKLILHFGENMKGELIVRLKIREINLIGHNYESNVIFENSIINSVKIHNFFNYSYILFFNLAPFEVRTDSNLTFKRSNLGKMQFHYCNFDAYNEVDIDQNNLSDIVTTGVNWFNYKKLREKHKPERVTFWSKNKKSIYLLYSLISIYFAFYNISENNPDVIKYRKIRELFRQLKTVMERQANRIQALQFKQYEMQAYKEELKRTKRFYNRERIVLWANQSNNHGQNWVKPILLATGFSFILISFILFSVSGEWWSFEAIVEHIQHYPRMMNPAFSLENIFGGDNTFSFWTNFWALLQRVLMSFFIYQTVVAFRKYGRG